MSLLSVLDQLTYALAHTVKDNSLELLNSVVTPRATQVLHSSVAPGQRTSRWIGQRYMIEKTVDGAVIAGVLPLNAWAKYAIPKGLPAQENSRVLAIENDPHTIDGFSGVITEGYGKGTKTLLLDDTGIVKIAGRTFPARVNYHVHDADRAGLHYDLVVEGVRPGTKNWELHLARGPFKGRYAFTTTSRGLLVSRMRDRGVVLAKPKYQLKPQEFLAQIDQEPGQWIVEQKLDGSLGNAVIEANRAVFRSHRETGETYYDRLPALEHLGNRSRLASCRLIFPGPDLTGTVVVGELYHPDGAPRVGGVLNSLPANARAIQSQRGPVEFYVWDIVKFRGRSVAQRPYAERRHLQERVVAEIRRFNPHWHIVPAKPDTMSAQEFYEYVTQQPLPWGEGIVAKRVDSIIGEDSWPKVKQVDFKDLYVIGILPGDPGTKYENSVGRFLVSDPETGGVGEVGSFSITDQQRQWIWDKRDLILPPGGERFPVAKIRVQEVTKAGSPRAGVFMQWHEGKGDTEAGLLMYAESLAGGDPKQTLNIKYALINAAGWKRG